MSSTEVAKQSRISLRVKYMLIFLGLFGFMLAALWLINRFYLQKYYVNRQLVRMEETRNMMEKLALDTADEDFQMQLQQKCERNGIAAVLVTGSFFGGDRSILFSAGSDERGMWRFFSSELDSIQKTAAEIYKREDQYIIAKTKDPMTQTDKITCIGFVEKGNNEVVYYLLTLSMARIEESSRLSSRFLLQIGLGILLLGGVIMMFAMARITKPIEQLSEISQKMASLDFSERFSGKSHDEIQNLGNSINELADALERTIADLKEANRKLEDDIREKEQENGRRKELLANISHELKTPIALVQGYAEGLRDGMCEDEETRTRYSEVILDEAGRMNRLVRQLLNLDELESGSMVIERNEFDLAALIRDIASSYMLKSSSADIRLELDLPETLPVVSDELLTEQIVQNYLSNAFHYVKTGGKIRVSACRLENDTLPSARLSVYNDGDLIPEEALDQLWNKFYKVDKARTRSYGGSGIGLSVVKAAVERLGGSCGVRNLKEGVEFTAEI